MEGVECGEHGRADETEAERGLFLFGDWIVCVFSGNDYEALAFFGNLLARCFALGFGLSSHSDFEEGSSAVLS